MQALPETDRVESILAFDFDGTLHDPPSGAVLGPRFFQEMRELRNDHHTRWGICTGRSLMQLMEGMAEVSAPFLPDFVVAREREIFFPAKFGRWSPEKEWNKRCEKEHRWIFRKARKALKKIRQYVEEETAARWVEMAGDPAGVVASSVEEMDRILLVAHEHAEKYPLLGHERNGIYLRFTHRNFSKGSALRHCGKMVGLDAAQILAVGDNSNDLSMLHRDIAERIGCPSNSLPQVKEQVLSHGGLVAKSPGCDGVLEVVGSYYGASSA